MSVVPNHQVARVTPFHTRANVAYFGTFGYELDLNQLPDRMIDKVKEQIIFMKEYREVLQFGDFYRLKSPFQSNETVWMCVSKDQKTALVGLNPDFLYVNSQDGNEYYGDELMNLGLLTSDETAGSGPVDGKYTSDFESRIYVLKAKD